MRSLYMLTRQADIPPEVTQLLARLLDIALDVRWTWSHSGDSFWRMLDADVWELTHNPNSILQNLSINKLHELAVSGDFQQQLDHMDTLRNDYLQYESWGDAMQLNERLGLVAYFTMEVGLGAALPLYAGGLGILAGDYLKAASDRGVPVVGVSLLYRQGYFRQMIDGNGWQQEIYAYNDSLSLPIKAVLDKDGSWLRVGVALPGRTVFLRVWQATVGRVTLYLLDSNIGLNSPSDQGITAQLYGGTKEIRLIQEIVLGVGGWRVLEALDLDVSICHLNEGHAAFVTLERARCFMKKHQLTFPQALWATRASNVFTTHTPVAGAFDKFNRELLTQYGQPLLEDVGLEGDLEQIWDLGQRPDGHDSEHFNMAYLALRTCAVANGVSELHGEVSRELFKPLFPHWPTAEIPVTHVTNGIHVPSWDSRWADKTWTKACGKERWRTEPKDLTQSVLQLSDEEIWAFCGKERADLVYHTRTRLRRQFAARGADPEKMQRADTVLDPNLLTLGMARRFTDYKRNNLLLRDPERLLRLLLNPDQPVQIVVAGKAHPQDTQGKRLLQEWARFVNRPEVASRAVLLADYDIELGKEMVQGVDLWVNTPRRPWEACGTSGMKVLVNGGLNLSSLDGWWAEAYSSDFGWAVGDHKHQSPAEQDSRDAEELYRLLENEIVPMFYDRDANGVPREWVRRVRASMASLTPQFSANRMLRDYTEQLYLPCAAAFRQRLENNAEIARNMPAWYVSLTNHWDELHWGQLDIKQTEAKLLFTVQLYLGDIAADSIAVQLYADSQSDEPSQCYSMTRGAGIPGAVNGHLYQVEVDNERPASHFTPRVIPYFATAQVPMEAPMICWWSGQPVKENF